MCVIAIKHLKKYGWVAGKNRDRSYKPTIKIKQSNRGGLERCLLWDDNTKWTEGVNEFGVAILNTTMTVRKDEKEGDKGSVSKQPFYSPTGKKVRTALLEKTPKDALNTLIDLGMEGFSVIFSKDEAYLLESPKFYDDNGIIDGDYDYKFIKLDKKKSYVRTNHGIFFPDAGYPRKSSDPNMIKSRKGSESRFSITSEWMDIVNEPMDILKALNQQPNKNPQMNPLRVSKIHGSHIMVTTGQILIIPSEHTLHYRPIWCELEVDFIKLDNPNSKTWFEVISSRKLLSIDESIPSFKEFYNTHINKK
jgi:hypothetical protein